MCFDLEIGYCQGRERDERLAAGAATCSAVHDAHFVMAERYADRASSLEEQRDAAWRRSHRRRRPERWTDPPFPPDVAR